MTRSTEHFPFPLITLPRTDSTNRYLSQLCDESPKPLSEFTTVCAEYQTAGKGQRGNSWEAAEGKNLLFSFVLYPTFLEAQHQFTLSQIVSLAVKEALDKFTADISIKWPNDIYWKEKKISGILIENELQGRFISRCVVGIGLNVNQETFRSDAPNPVSLKQITGRDCERYELLSDILTRTYNYYLSMQTETWNTFRQRISTCYEAALFRRTNWHLYTDAQGTFRARFVRVEPDGRFVLEDTEGNLRNYLFKEVQYVL